MPAKVLEILFLQMLFSFSSIKTEEFETKSKEVTLETNKAKPTNKDQPTSKAISGNKPVAVIKPTTQTTAGKSWSIIRLPNKLLLFCIVKGSCYFPGKISKPLIFQIQDF